MDKDLLFPMVPLRNVIQGNKSFEDDTEMIVASVATCCSSRGWCSSSPEDCLCDDCVYYEWEDGRTVEHIMEKLE